MGSAARAFATDAPPLQIDETNFRVRNCRLCHLKSLHPLGLLVVFFLRRRALPQIQPRRNFDEQQAP